MLTAVGLDTVLQVSLVLISEHPLVCLGAAKKWMLLVSSVWTEPKSECYLCLDNQNVNVTFI